MDISFFFFFFSFSFFQPLFCQRPLTKTWFRRPLTIETENVVGGGGHGSLAVYAILFILMDTKYFKMDIGVKKNIHFIHSPTIHSLKTVLYLISFEAFNRGGAKRKSNFYRLILLWFKYIIISIILFVLKKH